MTEPHDRDTPAWNCRPRTFSAKAISEGRHAALAAWDATQAAKVWALDRSLDPDGPTDDLPSWSEASTMTVAGAETLLRWLAGRKH